MMQSNFQPCHWSVRIRVRRGEELLFGSGAARLLEGTGRLGSLRAAAQEMGMSYRKALEIIRRSEAGLGQPLLEKSIGGVGGGGSSLTEYARSLTQRFTALERSVNDYTRALTRQSFPEWEEP